MPRDVQVGDLVELLSFGWEVIAPIPTRALGVVLSIEDEYMGGNMCTVCCDGHIFSIHDSEILCVTRRHEPGDHSRGGSGTVASGDR